MSRVALRPLALPPEHGAWAFLLEPVAVGLLVAPSATGGAIAIGAVAAFLARHPMLLFLRDLRRRRRYPRTAYCAAFAAGYGLLAIAALAIAVARGGFAALGPLLVAMPLAGMHFAIDLRNGGRTLIAELAGSVAPAATAAAIVIAASAPVAVALALWALLAARAVVSILYVRATLRGESRPRMLVAHVVAVVIAAALAATRVVTIGAVVAMLVLLVRALPKPAITARTLGLREVGYGAAMVVLLAL